MDMATLNETGKAKVHDALDASANFAKRGVDSTVGTLHSATDQVGDLNAAVIDQATSRAQRLAEQIQDNPLLAVTIAFGVGLISAKLFSSRSARA